MRHLLRQQESADIPNLTLHAPTSVAVQDGVLVFNSIDLVGPGGPSIRLAILTVLIFSYVLQFVLSL
jgi:hypothetical protein